MKANEIGIFEAKTHLSEILRRVKRGERFVITNRGEPIAELGPARRAKRPLTRGCARTDGYFMADDFDAPLDDFEEYM
jgi:prevent-host-death family protein